MTDALLVDKFVARDSADELETMSTGIASKLAIILLLVEGIKIGKSTRMDIGTNHQ